MKKILFLAMDEVNKNIPLGTPCPSFFQEEEEAVQSIIEKEVNAVETLVNFTSNKHDEEEEEEEQEQESENENESTTTPSPVPIALPDQPSHS